MEYGKQVGADGAPEDLTDGVRPDDALDVQPAGHVGSQRASARAVVDLVESLGGTVAGLVFVVELEFLPGRKRLEGYDVRSLIKYQS